MTDYKNTEIIDKTEQAADSKSDSRFVIVPFDRNSKALPEIYEIYEQSFPDSERKPFEMILSGQENGKMELFIGLFENRPAALLFFILGEAMDVLDYLAVSEKFRDHKLGSHILSWAKERRKRPFLVEIEDPRTAEDPMAGRRKGFYLRNELQDSGERIVLFGVPMQLLSWPRMVCYDEYLTIMTAYFGADTARYVRKNER